MCIKVFKMWLLLQICYQIIPFLPLVRKISLSLKIILNYFFSSFFLKSNIFEKHAMWNRVYCFCYHMRKDFWKLKVCIIKRRNLLCDCEKYHNYLKLLPLYKIIILSNLNCLLHFVWQMCFISNIHWSMTLSIKKNIRCKLTSTLIT